MYGGSFNGPYHMMPSTSNYGYQSTTVDLKKSKADAEKLEAEKAEAQAFEAKLRAKAKTVSPFTPVLPISYSIFTDVVGRPTPRRRWS
jgi:hypothetical protein